MAVTVYSYSVDPYYCMNVSGYYLYGEVGAARE